VPANDLARQVRGGKEQARDEPDDQPHGAFLENQQRQVRPREQGRPVHAHQERHQHDGQEEAEPHLDPGLDGLVAEDRRNQAQAQHPEEDQGEHLYVRYQPVVQLHP